jgi:hypothetical protein
MVVIDELHERSYNIESIINIVYKELLKYPTLKLMIVSATIDADSFKIFFGKATKVEVLNFNKNEKIKERETIFSKDTNRMLHFVLPKQSLKSPGGPNMKIFLGSLMEKKISILQSI